MKVVGGFMIDLENPSLYVRTVSTFRTDIPPDEAKTFALAKKMAAAPDLYAACSAVIHNPRAEAILERYASSILASIKLALAKADGVRS